MKISRTSASRAALAALLLAGAAIPALGQDTPESLLPPGFDEPTAPAPAPAPAPAQQSPRAPDAAPRPADSPAPSSPSPLSNDSAEAGDQGTAAPVDLTKYELPDFAKRSLDRVGVIAWGNPPFPTDAFGSADGRFLASLMRRIDAPVASRWVSIALRRALLSPIDTPRNINGADFAAERAWLLVRMGEALAARGLVQDVDTENYTPRLFQVAMQAALATADPAAMCPLADPASRVLQERGWALAQAMCAGLAGQPQRAGQLFQAAQRGSSPGDIDNLLAEKLLGIGAQGRRAVTIEWAGVDQLSAWRWGLATAAGETVPDNLYDTAGPQVRLWQAISPAPESRLRAANAELAAAQGVFSSAALSDLYGDIENADDAGSAEVAIARDLRTAFTDADVANRVAALRTLWNEPRAPRLRYARLVLTARAAAAIAPHADRAEDADRLVASMLAAGFDRTAMSWRSVVGRGSDGWAMLALADPAPGASVSSGDFDAYRGRADRRKAQLLLAGLAGLGRLGAGDARNAAASLDVAIGEANSWTRAIDSAAQRRDPGTVALLAAAGMQARSWDRVTPEALFHIVAGLRAAGMTDYARMIAVEAIARA